MNTQNNYARILAEQTVPVLVTRLEGDFFLRGYLSGRNTVEAQKTADDQLGLSAANKTQLNMNIC